MSVMRPLQTRCGRAWVRFAEATFLKEIALPWRAFVWRAVRRSGRRIGRIADWVIGSRLAVSKTPTATNGGQILVTLFTALLAETLAFNAFLRDNSHPPRNVLLSYVVLSCVPISGMVAVMRSHQCNHGMKKLYSFDQGAIMFGRWCLGASVAMVVFVTVAAKTGNLPGQEAKRFKLSITGVDNYHYRTTNEEKRLFEGDPGLIVYAELSSRDFTEIGRPDPLFLTVDLGGKLKQSWTITAMVGVIGGKDSDEETDPTLQMRQKSRGESRTAFWPHLREGRDYTIKIYMHYSGKGDATPTAVKELISSQEDGTVTVEAHYRE